MKVSDRNDWFELWFEDKQGMVATMASNMAADINAGYDYFGNSIQKQLKAIEAYKAEYEAQMDKFAAMEEKEVNRWCFYDMKKRGVIG